MTRFEIITIFPNFFDCFLNESLIARAQEKGLLEINIHNLRDWTDDPHRTVDDKPFGGGLGMVLKIEPIYKAVRFLKSKVKTQKSKVILFTPRGEKFNQQKAQGFAKLEQLILICGRYEGVDERVAKHLADEKISMGNYVLMGGELPAMVVVESVARLIPGVLGKKQLLDERITQQGGFVEYAQYTRPAVFEPENGKKWRTPPVLLSGNHKKIEEWRKKHRKIISS